MPKLINDDYDAIDPLSVLETELRTVIDGYINNLLTCEASRHDQIVGIIKGLKTAQVRCEDLRKKWNTGAPLSHTLAS